MNSQETIELKNIDPEDIGDTLQKVEISFGFKFGDTELYNVNTFGELSDIIAGKVQGEYTCDCTTQQAFYKICKAIAATLHIDKRSLTVDTRLDELFLRKQRRRQIKVFETMLGFQTKVLRPKYWITTSLVLLLLISHAGFLFYWQAGLPGLVFSVAGLFVSNKLGKELNLTTVGGLAEKIAREHSKEIKSNPDTINRVEIVQKVKELLMSDLCLEEEVLTRDAKFK
jgi:hypothetical protein